MAARRTNDVPVKDSAGDWNVTLTNPHPNLPYVVVELVLSKPDGTSETTQNQQGIFNLGKLPPGDYSYQYTAVNTINPVNRGPTTNKTFTVPPDTTTTTTTPATAATTDDSAAVIADPLDDEIDGMWAEIDPDAFTASNLRRAINLEIKDEIINILEIPVDTDNINARKISLQSHLQTEIESIDNEKAYILEQKNYYEGHPIHGVLDRLKNPKYPPTQKEIHEQVNLPLTPVGEEKKNLDLVESYNKIRDAKKELKKASTALRKKQKAAATLAGKFEEKIMEKNLERLDEMSASNEQFKEGMTNILTELSTTSPDVGRLQTLQNNIGELLTDNDIKKELEEINDFAEVMNEKVTELHTLSDEITTLKRGVASNINAIPEASREYHNLTAEASGEAPLTHATPTENEGFFARLNRLIGR